MMRLARTVLVATLSLVAAGTVASAAAPAKDVVPPRLAVLLSGAQTVVLARVASVETLDSGRVAVAELTPLKTLKGAEQPGALRVVEMRSLPSVPPLFTAGEQVLAFLVPAPMTSYLRGKLTAGDYLQASNGAASVVASTDAATTEEAAAIVARLVASSREPEPDASKRRAAERALVFDELGARHPAIVEDGIAGLATLRDLQPLSEAERSRLAATVTRSDIPARVRERLFAQVASLGLKDMIPALRDVQSSDVAVTAAAWTALRQLGAAPDDETIARDLRSADPAVRSAAARELLSRGNARELERSGQLAISDPEPKVRIAVIEAVSATGSPEAIALLERAFGDSAWEVRQAAGRGIFQIGGRPAIESFGRLSFSATPEMQRYAVTLLRASGVADDDPLLVKIRTQHPDAEVREVATHGLPFHEH